MKKLLCCILAICLIFPIAVSVAAEDGTQTAWAMLLLSFWSTLIYLGWRFFYSVPFAYGPVAVAANLVLLAVEVLGLFESMVLFLVDGRDSDGETVKVHDAELVRVSSGQTRYEGVTTLMTEHNMTLFLDESQSLGLGTSVELSLKSGDQPVRLRGVVTSIQVSRLGGSRTHTVEILDFYTSRLEYWQLLYDRIPTLPLSLRKDMGVLPHLWQNIAHRVARTTK